jgi:hypothetical protein
MSLTAERLADDSRAVDAPYPRYAGHRDPPTVFAGRWSRDAIGASRPAPALTRLRVQRICIFFKSRGVPLGKGPLPAGAAPSRLLCNRKVLGGGGGSSGIEVSGSSHIEEKPKAMRWGSVEVPNTLP